MTTVWFGVHFLYMSGPVLERKFNVQRLRQFRTGVKLNFTDGWNDVFHLNDKEYVFAPMMTIDLRMNSPLLIEE